MSDESALIVVSASARAVAWSARRAGISVFAVDQFGDQDLRAMAVSTRLVQDWPHGVVSAVRELPASDWVFGGGLENHPAVIAELAASHELLGCSPGSLAVVRDPFFMADCWRKAGLHVPQLCPGNVVPGNAAPENIASGNGATLVAGGDCSEVPEAALQRQCRWLRKPYRSAGGNGVRIARLPENDPTIWLQEFIPGDTVSGLYLASGCEVRLLGMAVQLAGCEEAGAEGFLYCGSVWPAVSGRDAVTAGVAVVQAAGLRGLFGIDFVRDSRQRLWPLEVNPRYPASAEVCERATGWPLMRWHIDACRRGWLPDAGTLETGPADAAPAHGKIVVYSPRSVETPDLWRLAARVLPAWTQVVDVPAAGTLLRAGTPVCSILASARNARDCQETLLRLAGTLRSHL